jgi:hypothetical protein
MITADTLKVITSFDSMALTRAINTAGHKTDSFIDAQFLGITTGNQFVYGATYLDPETNNPKLIKVFLTYNHETNQISAGY